MINPEIIFEDQDIVAINKPPGIVVNDAKTNSSETIQSWFWQRLNGKSQPDQGTELVPPGYDLEFGTPEEIFAQRQGLVHRLDKETSGVLLLAKNPGALVNLLAQFKKRQTQKTYTCLAHGKFGVIEDIISAPMGRSSQDRLKFGIDINGREAITHYKAIEFFPELDLAKLVAAGIKDDDIKLIKKNSNSYQGFSLVECQPKTGRTHQIRVHLTHIKHPLVGDKTYLGKKRKKLDPIWCQRHFLHASKLIFVHPRSGEQITIKADLSADLASTLELLKKD